MKSLTVNDLWKACVEQRKAGNGNKTILISSDDEGNEFHELFFLFSNSKGFEDACCDIRTDKDLKDCIMLG